MDGNANPKGRRNRAADGAAVVGVLSNDGSHAGTITGGADTHPSTS